MLFRRLIWCALAIAMLLGSAQSALQRLQTVPLILAAEVFEESKAEPQLAASHEHEHGRASGHDHGSQAWVPAEGFERTVWTWVANVLHAFSMALLALAVMGWWAYLRGATAGPFRLAFAVAASGWLSLHFWPSLGLPAEVPGMEAAALGARQGWWLLAAGCAAMACATLFLAHRPWRFVLSAALLALPFVMGAPQHAGDALSGFSGEAHQGMEALGHQFVWATTWLSLSFWSLLGLVSALVFRRWLQPVLLTAA